MTHLTKIHLLVCFQVFVLTSYLWYIFNTLHICSIQIINFLFPHKFRIMQFQLRSQGLCDNHHQLLIRITIKQQSKLNKKSMFKSGTESMERFIHNQWLHKAARLNLSMGPQLRSESPYIFQFFPGNAE